MTKIGVLGGAFNPPHKGHLIIAENVQKKLKLDKIFFVPSGIPPLKKEGLAEAKDRLEMTKLLIKEYPQFSILDYEIKKAKKQRKSYTIETIRYLKKRFKGGKIFWIIGEDSFREIIEGKWKEGLKALDLAKFIVISRPSHPFGLARLKKKSKENLKRVLRKVIFIKLDSPISATKIREKIKKKERVERFLPQNLLNYIKTKGIYEK